MVVYDPSLMTDMYEYTMLDATLQDGTANRPCVFEVFTRHLPEGPILSFGDTNMRTRFTCGAREFVNRWSEAGPTHHMAAATGRHIDTILKVAKIFNVPVDIVTR